MSQKNSEEPIAVIRDAIHGATWSVTRKAADEEIVEIKDATYLTTHCVTYLATRDATYDATRFATHDATDEATDEATDDMCKSIRNSKP